MLVWVSVCLFASNKRQNSLNNRAQFFVRLHVTPGKVYGRSKFQKLTSNKIRCSLNLEYPQNSFIKSAKFLLFLFYNVQCTYIVPIGPKFFVGPRVTSGKVYGASNFQKFASNKI